MKINKSSNGKKHIQIICGTCNCDVIYHFLPAEDDVIIGPGGKVQVATNPEFGKYLVDGEGKTLYFFASDLSGNSACNSESCLKEWEIYNRGELNVGGDLNKTDFGSITREDDRNQTTYKGWPLYYFKNDDVSGKIKGDGIDGKWFVAKPNYTIILMIINVVK